MISISVVHDLCQGHGQCQETAPKFFEVREDGLAHVIATAEAGDLPLVRDAARRCPVDAVRIVVDEDAAQPARQ